MRSSRQVFAVLALTLFAARPAEATFHLMQIERVIGGVNGNTTIQAIQLRMRASGQNLVSNSALFAHDASGLNPVTLISFPTDVGNFAIGSRVLAATANFTASTTPNLSPDFVLTNPIPASYLAAGSLTFEDHFGTVLWRLSWGGAGYTGTTNGDITNDMDGQFGPQFGGSLPSTGTQALSFIGPASALSTNNAADYSLTAGAATFTNNSAASGTPDSRVGVDLGVAEGSLALIAPAPNPVRASMSCSVVVPRETLVHVSVLDIGGRVVSALIDRTLPAGRHSFSWVAPGSADLPNGIYFLYLNAQGFRQTQRFALIR